MYFNKEHFQTRKNKPAPLKAKNDQFTNIINKKNEENLIRKTSMLEPGSLKHLK